MNIELIEPETVTELQDVAEIRDGSAVVKLNRTEAGLPQWVQLSEWLCSARPMLGNNEGNGNERLDCTDSDSPARCWRAGRDCPP